MREHVFDSTVCDPVRLAFIAMAMQMSIHLKITCPIPPTTALYAPMAPAYRPTRIRPSQPHHPSHTSRDSLELSVGVPWLLESSIPLRPIDPSAGSVRRYRWRGSTR